MKSKKLVCLVLTASILCSNLGALNVSAKGINDGGVYKPNMTSAKELTNVLKEWQVSKYKGEGMVISIIDSGIDYRHKDMKITDPSKAKIKNKNPKGKGKYFSDKIPYGYNYADKNDNIIDTGSMHGMHVAGIVAANGDSEKVSKFEAIQGVAPEAQLLAMKVFSNDPDFPSCNDEDVVEAIQDSVRLGADVINMSLGSDSGFVEQSSPIQQAIRKAEKKGVVVVVSAGNSGYSTSPVKVEDIVDTSVVGAPSVAKDALSVASFENSMVNELALTYKNGEEYNDAAYFPSEISPIDVLKGEYDVVDCGLGYAEDFQDKDLKGKVALIKRGDITFVEKKLNAQDAGAVAAIIYNKDGEKGYINMATDASVTIPSMFITSEDGLAIQKLIESGTKIKFPDKKINIDNPIKGQMSDFTSWGPTENLEFKPEVTAPGGNILSTANDNEYMYMSGTSMASPHTAGVMALVLQHMKELKLEGVSPKEKAELAKHIVINTAVPQIDSLTGEEKLPFSVRRQGAGLIDAAAAVKNNVVILGENNEAAVELKEIKENTKDFVLKIKNYGDKEETYIPKDLYGVLTGKGDEIREIAIEGASISFDKDKVVVPAGSTAEIKATLNIPEDSPKNIFVEGFLTFEAASEDGQTLGVPYMGFYGEWDESSIMDKPLWNENSYMQYTGVYNLTEDGQENPIGVIGEDEETQLPIVDKNLIAVTAAQGKVNVAPRVAFLRNAKTTIVDVVDEEENLVRNLSVDKDMYKDLWTIEPEDPLQDDNYMDNSLWAWDLTAYNSSNGKYETVKDGQYYFMIKAAIDNDDAEYQTMKLPIKVDSTCPYVEVTSDTEVNSRKYTLRFKAEDNLSGIKNFNLLHNGIYCTDKYGNENVTFNQDDNENYYVDLELESGDNNIVIYANDYAGNTTEYETTIAVQPLEITLPKANAVLSSGDFELNYSADYKLLADMRQFAIFVDGELVDEGVKELSYKFNDLTPGKHEVTVQAYDLFDNVIGGASTEVIVKSEELYINFTGVKREGSFYNSSKAVLNGDLSTGVKSFKILGEDVKVNPDLTFSKEINLHEGQNKVTVAAVDEKGKIYKYALNLYCDLSVPKLNIKDLDKANKDNVIEVAKDIETFKVKCEVIDKNPGFKLFVNGNEIAADADDYAKSTIYETEVKLQKGMNYIEIKTEDIAGNKVVKVIKVLRSK
jgi:lactocepin